VRIEGTYLLPATRDQVWELLNDPARLAKCLPGCERLEPTGPDRYQVAVKFAIAAISGKYNGAVELSEKRQPESLRMRLEGNGAPGFMRGEGRLEPAERDRQTELRYTGEAQVGGTIASVGQRMIEAATRRIIRQFFENATAELKPLITKG
jgi:carbon monoxide dehydrogenase subunit G